MQTPASSFSFLLLLLQSVAFGIYDGTAFPEIYCFSQTVGRKKEGDEIEPLSFRGKGNSITGVVETEPPSK